MIRVRHRGRTRLFHIFLMSVIVLLGPQRLNPTAAKCVGELAPQGPVGLITCGWQEAESDEADELGSQLERPIIKLLLHQRSDDIFQSDPEFFSAYRERQNELHQLQAFYRLRLGHELEAARELMQRDGSKHIIEPERQAAIEAVRTLDLHHLQRLNEVHERFDGEWHPAERERIARHRREVVEQIHEASVLVVAGGHVAVLLYRMRLLDLAPLMQGIPVVTWSAGAMALSKRVVLFHDSPPQGEGNPEVLESGLGLAEGVLPFPHARRRLRLEDPVRVALLARRFEPSVCVAMDEGSQIRYESNRWTARAGTKKLSSSGQMVEFSE